MLAVFRESIWCFGKSFDLVNFLITQDFAKSLKKITTFLDINVNDNEINKIASKTSFSEMKNNAVKENFDPNHTICALTADRNLVFRKGKQETPCLVWGFGLEEQLSLPGCRLLAWDSANHRLKILENKCGYP